MRQMYDFYPTPEWATRALLRAVPGIDQAKSILEPCAGDGHISKVLALELPEVKITTNDIDRSRKVDSHYDANYGPSWTYFPPVDWIISNPPFVSAVGIAMKSLKHARIGVAMLLRLSFLEPTLDRQDWLSENPPDELIVLPRISFTGDGKTDSVTCGWMVWWKVSNMPLRMIQVIRKT
jgi:hypothetical protein